MQRGWVGSEDVGGGDTEMSWTEDAAGGLKDTCAEVLGQVQSSWRERGK